MSCWCVQGIEDKKTLEVEMKSDLMGCFFVLVFAFLRQWPMSRKRNGEFPQ